MTTSTSSYIDTEKLAGADFSPHAHASSLVLSTNNPSDTSVDLTTPLSKALFDLQEIDSNIHALTSRSALEILQYTSTQNAAAARIITRVEEERSRLTASYARLEREILGQYDKATSAKLHAERSHQMLRLGRNVQRVLNLARQFEVISADSGLSSTQTPNASGRSTTNREDHRLILRASYMILSFRDLMSGKEASDLSKINIVRTIRGRVFEDSEAKVIDYGRRIVREFAISSLTASTTTTPTTGSSFRDAEDAKSRFTSASHILYLLSPAPQIDGKRLSKKDFEAEYLLRALQGYLQTAITSSSAGIARGLGQLPTLDRALLEVSARCQNVVALEALLRSIAPPDHPMLLKEKKKTAKKPAKSAIDADDDDEVDDGTLDSSSASSEEDTEEPSENLLTLLLDSLDTSSLPSYFWRSLASQLSSRVQEILNRGGIVARTLKANRDDVRNQIRDCVLKGSKMPSSLLGSTPGMGSGGGRGKDQTVGGWEREAAVMVGSVIGPLGK